jgi:hypothetical protein
MADQTRLTISRDSFLEPLGLGSIATRIREPDQRAALYRLACEYFESEGLIETAGADAGTDLAWRVPNTAITIRLSDMTAKEATEILGLAMILLGAGANPTLLSLTPLLTIRHRVHRLRTQTGERSVFEAVGEAKPPTADQVAALLYGKPCRHPDSGCRFMDVKSTTCKISRDETEKTIEWLIGAQVLQQLNPTDPIEYGIVI